MFYKGLPYILFGLYGIIVIEFTRWFVRVLATALEKEQDIRGRSPDYCIKDTVKSIERRKKPSAVGWAGSTLSFRDVYFTGNNFITFREALARDFSGHRY
jgi:hypothetical protein